jgi:putative DNA primase/helicase
VNALEWFRDALRESGSHQRGQTFQCPAHEDSSPSLAVASGHDGRVLIHCFGGCSNEEVVRALGVSMSVLFEPHPLTAKQLFAITRRRFSYPTPHYKSGGRSSYGNPISTEIHDYTPSVRMVRNRYGGGKKKIHWEVNGQDGWWRYSKDLDMHSLPLYHEQEIYAAKAFNEPVILCESESSVDALQRQWLYATTWAGGCASPNIQRLRTLLRDIDVIWVPDQDPPGRKCSSLLIESLAPYVYGWHQIEGERGEDARDILKRLGREAFLL